MQDDSGKKPQDKDDTSTSASQEPAAGQTEPTFPVPDPEPEPASAPGDVPADEPHSPTDLKKKAAFGALLVILVTAVFASGIFYSNFINKAPETPPAQTSELPKATLTIESPANEQAFTISQVEVRGKTTPGGVVSVYTENYADIFEADAQGNFSGSIALDEGPNEVTFVAFGDKYEEQEETRSVVYVMEEDL